MSERNVYVSDIPEDTVQVLIFSAATDLDIESWDNLCIQINSYIKSISRDYIWQRDEFKLCLPILCKETEGMPMHLISTVCFGDNIEDEWFTVYLAMEISKIYENFIIRIIDSDGDFLLIEAADYLPAWINPENTENRVFIFRNTIHIIPPNLADLNNMVTLRDGLKIISNFSEKTKGSTEVQEAILTRIRNYPQKIEESFHRALVKLPLDIAALLKLQPSLIAPIVNTYCSHDIIDAKTCTNLHYTDYKLVEVKFTKYLYAMLVHSKLIRNVKHDYPPSIDKRDTLGIKLTCGYQMLMNTLKKDIFCTKEYLKFEENLKNNGYFRDNIEGSLKYKKLLEKARKYFLDVECPINSHMSKKVTELTSTDEFLRSKDILKKQNISENNLTEDTDAWLNIHPNQLNELLNKRYGNKVKFNTDDVLTPETVTSKITNFLKQSSDFEGVDAEDIENTKNDVVDFDADQFANCLEKIMEFLSSDVNEIYLHDDSDIECESEMSDDDDNANELDKELAGKLHSFKESSNSSEAVVFNLAQSIKEEGLSGPSSNLLTTVGIHKNDILDSDDD